jgi:hypothetical protein
MEEDLSDGGASREALRLQVLTQSLNLESRTVRIQEEGRSTDDLMRYGRDDKLGCRKV